MTASKYRVAYEYSGLGLGIVRAGGKGSPINVRVSTWADGFGSWHVAFAGTGNPQYDRHIARVAIKHQAMRHDAASEDWTPAVVRLSTSASGDVLYGERDDA
jgi:hypothetical protein